MAYGMRGRRSPAYGTDATVHVLVPDERSSPTSETGWTTIYKPVARHKNRDVQGVHVSFNCVGSVSTERDHTSPLILTPTQPGLQEIGALHLMLSTANVPGIAP